MIKAIYPCTILKKNQKQEFFTNEKNLLPPYKKKLSERSISLAFIKLLANFIEELQRDIKYRFIISKNMTQIS